MRFFRGSEEVVGGAFQEVRLFFHLSNSLEKRSGFRTISSDIDTFSRGEAYRPI